VYFPVPWCGSLLAAFPCVWWGPGVFLGNRGGAVLRVPPLETQTHDRAGCPSLGGWITCRIVSRFSVCMVASTPRRLVRGAR